MTKAPRLFVAIVGDMEDSRGAPNRASFSKTLERELRGVNARFAEDIWAPLVTVRGLDEISGVLKRPDRSFEVCACVNERIWPRRFRWGIGRGTIDVGMRTRDAGAMDGAAFHAAAEALTRAEDEKTLYAITSGSAAEGADGAWALAQASMRLYAEIVARWTPTVPRVAAALRDAPSQVEAARALKMKPQHISQIVRRGSITELHEFENAVRQWLGGSHRD